MKTIIQYEAEVLPGLESFASKELRETFGHEARLLKAGNGRLPFELDAGIDMPAAAALRTVNAVYQVLTFDTPRPKGLLGHQAFTAIIGAAQSITGGKSTFQTLSLDAAGSDSAVMQRIKTEISIALRLAVSEDKGDLHLRIRPAPDKQGWQVLLRLTPRPLVTRAWRQHNFQGALNAAAASAMAGLIPPQSDDRILNLMCGSGTLMVERAALGPSARLMGVDNDLAALSYAQDHLRLSDTDGAGLICGDTRALAFPADSFNVLLADLPFGQLIGSHRENITLYPAVLAEAGRIATKDARFALITHEKRLINTVLSAQSHWFIVRTFSINLNGLHPEILLLEKQR